MSNFLAIPQELRDAPRWVLWNLEERSGKPTKVPYTTDGKMASTTNPQNWVPFNKAWQVYNSSWGEYRGIGCVIASPFVGIDLDKCRNSETGEVEPWAVEAIKDLDSYTELSPSGKGFHIWVKGSVPPGGNRTGRVEIYSKARYFTMTGLHYEGTPTTVNDRDLTDFHKKHIGHQTTEPEQRDTSQSAKEFRVACDLWRKIGADTKEEDAVIEFFKVAEHRDKWEKHRDYIARTIRAAKQKVFGDTSEELERELNHVRFSEIDDKALEWLWESRIPKGKMVVFSGNPDCGKTTMACEIIAHYTTGTEYPDGAQASDTGEVFYLGSEDDPADTLKPRLLAAGANIDRVHYVKGIRVKKGTKRLERALALDSDLSAIEVALQQNPRIGLVVIDPITSYLGKADLNKEQSLRDTLTPIKDLAERMKVTFLCLGHFSKRADVGVLHKVGGAVAMTGVARAVWLFMKNPEVDGQYLMLLGKGNLTNRREGLKYSIAAKNLPSGSAPTIEWQGLEKRDAETVAETLGDRDERAAIKAEHFLKEHLKVPMLSDTIFQLAQENGVKRSTLFKIKKNMNIRSEKRFDGWWWIPCV